jgi:PAS domain S-box-containing protein
MNAAEAGLLAPFADARVVIVDDDESARLLALKLLRLAGLRSVHVLPDPREAVTWVQLHRPDLVLLDLHMPHVNGYDVLSALRERASSTELPVIVLSADNTMQASDRALELGANDFVLKPLPRIALIHRVRNLLDMRAAHRNLERRQRWVEGTERFSRDLFAGEIQGDRTLELARRAQELADADHVVVLEADPGRPGRPGSPGWTPLQTSTTSGLRISVSKELCAQVARGEYGLAIDDVTADDEVVVSGSSGVGPALVLPARGADAVRAAMVVLRHRDRPAFTEADLAAAQLFVRRAAIAMDLADRRAERRRSAEFFRVLVSQVEEYAILRLTPGGRIASWNAGAERLFGHVEQDAVGRAFDAVVPIEPEIEPADEDAASAVLREADLAGQARRSGWGVRPDGTRFWGETVVTALRDERELLIGFAAVTRDLTEARRLEDAREAFFAALSHDLRMPLNAIQGFVEMLPLVDGERREEFIERVQSNVRRLALLTDRLIDHARLRAGVVDMTPEVLDLKDVTSACLDDLGPLIGSHPVAVVGDTVQVVADGPALGRVVANLLVNAAKYSPADAPIEIRFAVADGQGRLEVADHGRGIPAQDLPTIFDEFARGSLAESDGGTGLGLASVSQLIALQGGRVHLDSEVGAGTTVTVTLPLALEDQRSARIL